MRRVRSLDYRSAEIRKGGQFLGSACNAPEGNTVRGTFTAMDMRTNKIAWQKQWDHADVAARGCGGSKSTAQIRHGGGAMPPFSGVLSAAQIDAVAHYVVEQIAPKA
jgi:hypothetical protein